MSSVTILEVLENGIQLGWNNSVIPATGELFDHTYSYDEDPHMYELQHELNDWAAGKSYRDSIDGYSDDVQLEYFSGKASAYYIGGFALRFAQFFRSDIGRIKCSMTVYHLFDALSQNETTKRACEFLNYYQAKSLIRLINIYIDYGFELFGASKSEVAKLEMSQSLALLKMRVNRLQSTVEGE
jgi:hypothetical protein